MQRTENNLSTIAAALERKGIKASVVTTVKNSVKCVGLQIGDHEQVRPVVYPGDGETDEMFIERIIDIASHDLPKFDLGCLHDRDYAFDHAIFSVQKQSDEAVVKCNCLNVEAVVRIVLGYEDEAMASFKVTEGVLATYNVSADELISAAKQNMARSFEVHDLTEILGLPDSFFDPRPMYVVTSSLRNGASALLFPEVFRRFCLSHGIDAVFCLPSSTEELILLPTDSGILPSVLAEMVNTVNDEVVDPTIALDPVVYKYTLESDEVVIAAEYMAGNAA